MTPQDRIAEIGSLQGGLAAAWPTLLPWLTARRAELVEQLVLQDDGEARGRIKQLDELKALPATLNSEAVSLQHPQQEGELP